MSIMRHAALVVGVALAAGLLSTPGNAASEPDIVRAEVERAAKECRDKGGKPNTEAMLTALDLTGRGGPDWIVDYARVRCDGVPHPFCGSGGCAMQIFVWTGDNTWTSVFSQLVTSFRIAKTRSGQVINLRMAGAACGKANHRSCRKTLQFNRDGLIPARAREKSATAVPSPEEDLRQVREAETGKMRVAFNDEAAIKESERRRQEEREKARLEGSCCARLKVEPADVEAARHAARREEELRTARIRAARIAEARRLEFELERKRVQQLKGAKCRTEGIGCGGARSRETKPRQ